MEEECGCNKANVRIGVLVGDVELDLTKAPFIRNLLRRNALVVVSANPRYGNIMVR